MLIDIYTLSNMQVADTEVESNSCLGLGERYNQQIRQIYLKIFVSYPEADPALDLSADVK